MAAIKIGRRRRGEGEKGRRGGPKTKEKKREQQREKREP